MELITVFSRAVEALNRIGKNTDAAGTTTLFALLNRGGVKNVQRGSATITAASVNVTVSAVVMAKSQLKITWKNAGQTSNPALEFVCATLTTTTNILLERGLSTGTENITISWELTEYY